MLFQPDGELTHLPLSRPALSAHADPISKGHCQWQNDKMKVSCCLQMATSMKVLILQLQVCHVHTKLTIFQLLSGCEQTHCNIPQARDNEWIPHVRRDPALYS